MDHERWAQSVQLIRLCNCRRPVFEQAPAQMAGHPVALRHGHCHGIYGNHRTHRGDYRGNSDGEDRPRFKIGSETVVVCLVRALVKMLMQLRGRSRHGEHQDLQNGDPNQGREEPQPWRFVSSRFHAGRDLFPTAGIHNHNLGPGSGVIWKDDRMAGKPSAPHRGPPAQGLPDQAGRASVRKNRRGHRGWWKFHLAWVSMADLSLVARSVALPRPQ